MEWGGFRGLSSIWPVNLKILLRDRHDPDHKLQSIRKCLLERKTHTHTHTHRETPVQCNKDFNKCSLTPGTKYTVNHERGRRGDLSKECFRAKDS